MRLLWRVLDYAKSHDTLVLYDNTKKRPIPGVFRFLRQLNAGAAIAGVAALRPICGQIKVAVAQSDDLSPSVTAYLYVE